VLLFDEPLSNLDAQLRTELRVDIRRLQQSLGLTAVYVTHDQEEALAISDQIAILRAGRIEQIGSPEEIYQRPQTAFVAEFLGGTNMLPGIAGAFDGTSTEVAACGTTIRVPGQVGEPGRKLLLSIRPEALRLTDSADAHPLLHGKLVLREFLGQIQRLHATLPDGTPIRASELGARRIEATAGSALAFAYDPAQIIAYPAS
jgi:ABC-type Fe3+/spermidine/putrescine transport system ATPase subunit